MKYLDMQMDYYRSLSDSEDNWRDYKVHRENILFPNHNEKKIYPVTTYNIRELNNK